MTIMLPFPSSDHPHPQITHVHVSLIHFLKLSEPTNITSSQRYTQLIHAKDVFSMSASNSGNPQRHVP
jgi:hypothetical protein